jgi:hypothetical protein
MRFVRLVFRVAGIYGVLLIGPMFFLEDRIGRDYPPAINHPEYFYGFVATCLGWQLMYLLISTDPVRYRPAIILGGLGKLAFFISCLMLYRHERIPGNMIALASVDMVLVVLFAIAWTRIPSYDGL